MLMMYRLGLTKEEIGKLSDEDFAELAGIAYFIDDRQAQNIKAGIMIAVKDMFR